MRPGAADNVGEVVVAEVDSLTPTPSGDHHREPQDEEADPAARDRPAIRARAT